MNATLVSPRMPMRDDLKLAALLGLAGAISAALLIPYLQALMPDAFARLPMSLPLVALLQSLQAFALLTLLSFIGLRLLAGTSLSLPWLRAWMAGTPAPAFPWRDVVLGGVIAAGAALVATPLFAPFMPAPFHPVAVGGGAGALAGLLASFYGAISEELQMRLFLMALIVWLAGRLLRRPPSPAVYWTAIVLAAVIFGALHLPAAHHIWPMGTVVVMRTIVLNGLAGVVFGWMFWRRGLEAAMAAHFVADLVLHVATPLIAGATT